MERLKYFLPEQWKRELLKKIPKLPEELTIEALHGNVPRTYFDREKYKNAAGWMDSIEPNYLFGTCTIPLEAKHGLGLFLSTYHMRTMDLLMDHKHFPHWASSVWGDKMQTWVVSKIRELTESTDKLWAIVFQLTQIINKLKGDSKVAKEESPLIQPTPSSEKALWEKLEKQQAELMAASLSDSLDSSFTSNEGGAVRKNRSATAQPKKRNLLEYREPNIGRDKSSSVESKEEKKKRRPPVPKFISSEEEKKSSELKNDPMEIVSQKSEPFKFNFELKSPEIDPYSLRDIKEMDWKTVTVPSALTDKELEDLRKQLASPERFETMDTFEERLDTSEAFIREEPDDKEGILKKVRFDESGPSKKGRSRGSNKKKNQIIPDNSATESGTIIQIKLDPRIQDERGKPGRDGNTSKRS